MEKVVNDTFLEVYNRYVTGAWAHLKEFRIIREHKCEVMMRVSELQDSSIVELAEKALKDLMTCSRLFQISMKPSVMTQMS